MPKPFLTYEQQLQLLKLKGLNVPDEDEAKEALLRIGYFSLIGGYKYPFKNPTTRQYKDGASFSDLLSLYRFDEELRHILLRYLLIVERAIKTQIAYVFCATYGEAQTSYLTAANYSSNPKHRGGIQRLIGTLDKLACRPTDYPYINHQQNAHHNVPLWVLINAVTFGSMSKMFCFLPQSLQSRICRSYPLNSRQMEQILSVLTKFRNVCAHGERLFSHTTMDDIADLQIHCKLGIPKQGNQYKYGKHDLFAVLISLRYLLLSAQYKELIKAISTLISKFSTACSIIDEPQLLEMMGFPFNWKKITAYKL
jgi:abortive infection bacteriophage resistance protein